MFAEATFSDVVPFKAIAFQTLYLLVAIAIEGFILFRYLDINHKTAMRYAATINLLATFVGWIVFFITEAFSPPLFESEIISFVFFERFLFASASASLSPFVIFVSFLMFIGTFITKWLGLRLLEFVLGKAPQKEDGIAEQVSGFRILGRRVRGVQFDNQANAVFVANAASFTAILLLIFLRIIEPRLNDLWD